MNITQTGILAVGLLLGAQTVGAETISGNWSDVNNDGAAGYHAFYEQGAYTSGTKVGYWGDSPDANLPPPSPDNDYTTAQLPTPYRKSDPADMQYVFNGNLLTITGTLCNKTHVPQSVRFANEGISFANGAVLRERNETATTNAFYGTMTAVKKMYLRTTVYTNYVGSRSEQRLYVTLKGDAASSVVIDRYNERNPGWETVRLLGDCSAFLGKVQVAGNDNRLQLGLTNPDFPGTIELTDVPATVIEGACSGSSSFGLEAPASVRVFTATAADQAIDLGSSTLTVGDLTLVGNTITSAYDPERRVCGGIVVTNRLTVSAPVTFRLTGLADPGIGVTQKVAVVTLAAGATGTLSADDIRFDFSDCANGDGSVVDPTVVFEDGVVSVTWTPCVKLLKSAKGGIGTADGRERPNKEEHAAEYWSDEKLPHSGARYLSAGYSLYWSYNAAGKTQSPYEFPGDAFVLQNSSEAIFTSATITFKELVCGGTPTITRSGSQGMLYGPVRLLNDGGYVTFRLYGNCTQDVCDEVSGMKDIRASYRGNNNPGGTLKLSGLNTNWVGKVCLACQGYEKSTTDWTPALTNNQFVTLRISDARNLGAPLAAFAYDGLLLRDWGALETAAPVELSDQTHGVCVTDRAQVVTPAACDLTLAQPLTMAGRLVKRGAGTLVLGCVRAPKFGNAAQTDEPTEGQNLVDVWEGGLGVATTNAVDGLAVTFTNGTRFVVTAAAAADGSSDLAQFGAVNLKACGGFASVATDGKINVGFDPAIDVSNGFTAAICTVSAEAATALGPKLVVTKPRKGYMARLLEPRTNADGSVTFLAEVTRTGIIFVVR